MILRNSPRSPRRSFARVLRAGICRRKIPDRHRADAEKRQAGRQCPGPRHGAGDPGQQQFTLQGKFAGLSSPATEAHLYMGNVMGGTRARHRRPHDPAGAERRHFRHLHPDAGSGRGFEGRQALRHARQPERAQGQSVGLVSAGAHDRRAGRAADGSLVHSRIILEDENHRPGEKAQQLTAARQTGAAKT